MADLYYHDDQAGGLRRIMAGPQPRIFSVLSAIGGQDKSRMLINLAVSLQRHGNEVLLINANSQQTLQAYGASGLSTLAAVAACQAGMPAAVKRTSQGYSVANLMTTRQLHTEMALELRSELNRLLDGLARQYDVLLLDAELTSQDVLPLPVLNDGDIIIQLNRHPDAIKQAYRLIKQVYNQLGCRSFGILMTDVQSTEAKDIFNNLSQVARRYLSVRLELMGVIPSDEYLKRAGKLGRAVVEAFPAALASTAFQDLAQRLSGSGTAYVAG